jgi:hypothetical protein
MQGEGVGVRWERHNPYSRIRTAQIDGFKTRPAKARNRVRLPAGSRNRKDTMEDNNYQDDIDQYIQYLVDEGGLVLTSIDEDGQPVYRHNMEVLEVIAPEYAAMHLREIEDAIISLYEKGLVKMDITDEGEPVYSLADNVDLKDFL